MRIMRDTLPFVVAALVWAGGLFAGENPFAAAGLESMADILPPRSLALLQLPESSAEAGQYRNTIFRALADDPDMQEFIADCSASRKRFIQTIASESKLDYSLINSIFEGRKSVALMDFAQGKDGGLEFSVALTIKLDIVPDKDKIFEAIKTIVREIRRRSGDETPEAKLIKEAAWQESWPGGHNVMVIASTPPVRCVLLGNTILFFRGASDGLKLLLANYDNRLAAKNLARDNLFKAVVSGSGASVAKGLFYVNTSRLYTLLSALRLPRVTRLLDALGLNSVRAMAYAGGFHQEGLSHTLYLYAPGERRGLLKVLGVKVNAEQAAAELPADAPAMIAARVKLSHLYREIPLVFDAAERAMQTQSPIGLSALAGKQEIFGVPASEFLATLGDAILLQSGQSGTMIRFDTANVPAFLSVIGRMEKSLGARFSTTGLTMADGQKKRIYYFNRSGYPVPLAPSFCILRQNSNGVGVVCIATHPQVIKASLTGKNTGRLSQTTDYQRVMKGMGGGYGVFIYADNRESYRQVYDSLLPIINVWTAAPSFSADPGKLPPARDIMEHFFGYGVGIKNSPDGITFNSYGAFGLGGLGVHILDKLVVSNPAILGVIAAEFSRWTGVSNDGGAAPKPAAPADNDGGIPGIGG